MTDTPDASLGGLDLEPGLRDLITPELAPGERLVWAAREIRRPRPRRPANRLVNAIWAAGLLSLALGGLVIYRFLDPLPPDLSAFLVATCLVVGFVGCFNGLRVLAGLARDAERHRHLTLRSYAITDRRAILWVPGDQPDSLEVISLPRGTIRASGLRRIQYPDGTGDLYLRADRRLAGRILGIRDVKRVEELVKAHLIEPTPGPTPAP